MSIKLFAGSLRGKVYVRRQAKAPIWANFLDATNIYTFYYKFQFDSPRIKKNRESFLWIHANSLIFVTFLSFLKNFRKFIISKILDLQTLESTNSLHLKIFWMIVLYVYCQKLKNWLFFFIFVFEFLTFNILIYFPSMCFYEIEIFRSFSFGWR